MRGVHAASRQARGQKTGRAELWSKIRARHCLFAIWKVRKFYAPNTQACGTTPVMPRENEMPDIPELDFIGSLCEIWSGLNYAAYHLCYIRVYTQTAALQTEVDQVRKQDQVVRDMAQIDVVICRAHLAAFFWQLAHAFEALRIAIARGQKEYPTEQYLWKAEKQLEEIEQTDIVREIKGYRNKAHEIPGIIGCRWEEKGGRFLHHFLPSIAGRERKEDIEMNAQLQHYFEFVANLWLSFVPGDLKDKFPRKFSFPVTIPNTYVGELPPELENVPQFQVELQPYDRTQATQGEAQKGGA